MRLSDLCRLVSKVSYRASMRPLTAPSSAVLPAMSAIPGLEDACKSKFPRFRVEGLALAVHGVDTISTRTGDEKEALETTAAALMTMLFGHSTGHMDFGESFVNLLLNETEQAQNKHPN